ncbi:MAG: histidine phosphatase family protein [Proteobacteria bacterium]|nr:histidine phosphatase family protein [Pseudomonadota bacterium]
MRHAANDTGDGAEKIPPVPFYFLRHGQTDWNREHRLQGNIDVPLNETGLEQAYAAAARLAGLPIATIVASPLSRARRTAEIAAEALGLPVELDPGLAEVALGVREGTPEDGLLARWQLGETPEGAETYVDFCRRAQAGVRRALARPGPVLVVAHGGVFSALRRAFGLAPSAQLGNAIPIYLLPHHGRWDIAEL